MSRQNPRNYPDTLARPVSGRPMVRGEKQVTFQIEEQRFGYPPEFVAECARQAKAVAAKDADGKELDAFIAATHEWPED